MRLKVPADLDGGIHGLHRDAPGERTPAAHRLDKVQDSRELRDPPGLLAGPLPRASEAPAVGALPLDPVVVRGPGRERRTHSGCEDGARGGTSPRVHSAHRWREVLGPVVARYRNQTLRRLLRSDAAFALPDVYEYLEAEGFQYAIRLPANQVLQERIAPLLTRPVGRSPHYVRRFYSSFRYQAQSWNRERRVVAKVEWHRPAVPPRLLHRDEPPSAGQEGGRLLQPARHGRAVDQGGEERGEVDAALVHDVPRERRPPAAPRASVQPRQLPPHAGAADGDRGLVPDKPSGEGGEARGEGGRQWPLPRLSDGRGGGTPGAVPGHPQSHRRLAPSRRDPMLTREGSPPPPSQGQCVFGVCPATTCRGQEEPWHPASVAVRPESGCKEPEVACQVAPRRAMHRSAGAFAPCIWRMSAKLPGGSPRLPPDGPRPE